jgi:hypothetical protein
MGPATPAVRAPPGGVAAGHGSGSRGERVGEERFTPYVLEDGTVDKSATAKFVDRTNQSVIRSIVQMNMVAGCQTCWIMVNSIGNIFSYVTSGTVSSFIQLVSAASMAETRTASKQRIIEFNAVEAINKYHADGGAKAKVENLIDSLRAFGISSDVLARTQSTLAASFVAHSNMPGGEEQVFRELRTRVAEGLDTYCNECELVAAAAEGVGPEPEPAADDMEERAATDNGSDTSDAEDLTSV